MWNETESAVASGLAQLQERLTTEEKRAFARLVNWEELQHLRLEAVGALAGRPVGDPRVYVGTTADGLSLDLPVEHVPTFVIMLPHMLAMEVDEGVEIWLQDGEGSQEYSCTVTDLKSWLKGHAEALNEGSAMIEFGPHTLITGGVGCLSLTLRDVPVVTIREIARQALALCGFHCEFKGDHFSAIVWEDQLEVTE